MGLQSVYEEVMLAARRFLQHQKESMDLLFIETVAVHFELMEESRLAHERSAPFVTFASDRAFESHSGVVAESKGIRCISISCRYAEGFVGKDRVSSLEK